MNWKPGDRAIIGSVDRHTHMRGEECTLIEHLGHVDTNEIAAASGAGFYINDAWKVDTSDGHYAIATHCLRPIYDGNEPVTWESCEWQPKEMHV